ncbi:MAG: rhodanese-like domain-containing protein [Chromatiales bacterium]
MKAVTPSELYTRLHSDGDRPVLLDVREAWEFAICHIEGSRNVPMADVAAALPALDAAAPTVVICHHGVRSAEVVDYLDRLGFRDVSNLEGGIDGWAREINQSMPTY